MIRRPDLLDRYRRLPDGETVKEAARWLDGKHPELATRLREIAKGLEMAEDRIAGREP